MTELSDYRRVVEGPLVISYERRLKAAAGTIQTLREALEDARAGFEAVQDILKAMRGGRRSIAVDTQIERIDQALTGGKP